MAARRFEGKTALVTGAGSGIGRETCVAFAREGASLIAIDLSMDGLEATLALVEAEGGRAQLLQADVSDEQSVTKAFERAMAAGGQIDCAFNNAGITQSSTLAADLTLAEWERVLKVNVTGVWLCLRAELRAMRARGAGAIVNTASFLSTHSMNMQTAYVASKHAVLGLTKNAAIEYAANGVRINAVAPGGIPTGMMAQSLSGLSPEEQRAARQSIGDLHPMKRLGTTSEIANAVLFLCSDEASFITGACLSVDGGWAAL